MTMLAKVESRWIGTLLDVPVHRTIAGIAAGKDEMLERAIEVVGSVDHAEPVRL